MIAQGSDKNFRLLIDLQGGGGLFLLLAAFLDALTHRAWTFATKGLGHSVGKAAFLRIIAQHLSPSHRLQDSPMPSRDGEHREEHHGDPDNTAHEAIVAGGVAGCQKENANLR